jgi:hypothetical protein
MHQPSPFSLLPDSKARLTHARADVILARRAMKMVVSQEDVMADAEDARFILQSQLRGGRADT